MNSSIPRWTGLNIDNKVNICMQTLTFMLSCMKMINCLNWSYLSSLQFAIVRVVTDFALWVGRKFSPIGTMPIKTWLLHKK